MTLLKTFDFQTEYKDSQKLVTFKRLASTVLLTKLCDTCPKSASHAYSCIRHSINNPGLRVVCQNFIRNANHTSISLNNEGLCPH